MPRRSLLILILLLTLALGAGTVLVGTAQVDTLLGKTARVQKDAVRLDPGKGIYTLLFRVRTATDLHGVLRIALEGAPGVNYTLFNLSTLLHPGNGNHPQLQEDLLLLPGHGDHFELGILLQPKPAAPVDVRLNPFLPDCCKGAGQLANSSLSSVADLDRPLQLNFYDSDSGRLLLEIPIRFGDQATGRNDIDELFRPETAAPKQRTINHG